MKYKIKEEIQMLADGGGFSTFTPIIHSAPVQQQTNNQTSVENKPESSSILDEKMLEYLYKTGGLVNDVNQLVSELIKIEKSSENPFLKGNNRAAALQIVAKINEVNQNKSNWDSAIQRAKEAGGLGEIAVDTYGRVFTKGSDNKIQTISLSQYSQNRDSIKPLSVQELMYERQYNSSLAGQNGVFTVADNAIGLNKITDHIKGLIAALGVESETSSKFYSKTQVEDYLKQLGAKKPTAEEVNGLNILQDILATPGDYAQVSLRKDSQRNHLSKALGYIWNTLGEPAQQKLTATAVMNGVNNPKQFIMDMLESETDYSTTTEITAKELPGSTSSGKDSDKKTINPSPQELFHGDRLYTPGMTYEINNPKAGVTMKVTATGIEALLSLRKEGESIGPKQISSILTNDNYMSILDPSKAFIGDQKVDPMLMREVAYTGENVAKVYLPTNPDGTPNLAQMNKFNEVYQIFDANKESSSVEELELMFKKAGFSGVNIKELKGSDGTATKVIAESGRVKPFLALPIITNSASDISNNPWMVEITGDQEDAAKLIMNEAFTVYSGTASNPKSDNLRPEKFWSLETPYKGVIFVGYRPSANAILSSTMGHLSGKAPTETDLYRNQNFSSGSYGPTGIESSARLLNN